MGTFYLSLNNPDLAQPVKLAIVCTHPIQYYSPWFRHLAGGQAVESGRREAGRKQEVFEFEVFYAHRQTAKGQAEAGFGVVS